MKIRANTSLYILDTLCMFSALGLALFILYLLPYLFLGYVNYDLPPFIFNFDTQAHRFLFLLPLVIGVVAFLMISRLITFYLEMRGTEPGLPHIRQSEIEQHQAPKTNRSASLKGPTAIIIGLISLVLFLLFLGEYFVFFRIV